MPLSPLVEHTFTFHHFNYAVQCWGDPAHEPVLALHGWLDNSESFSVLAEHLDSMYLIVPDLAGHGLSDQRIGFAEYSLWSETNELCAIADALNVKQFALLGHSRGAMMAHIVAAVVPERITALILLDAVTPIPVGNEQILPRLRKRHHDMTQITRVTRRFNDKNAAIHARCQSDYGGISRDNAERLAKRGISEKDGYYFWHADSKLKLPAGAGLTAEQITHLLGEVAAPTLALVAREGLMAKQKNTPLAALAHKVIQANGISVKTIEGDHFLHMSESVNIVANEVLNFIHGNENKETHRHV